MRVCAQRRALHSWQNNPMELRALVVRLALVQRRRWRRHELINCPLRVRGYYHVVQVVLCTQLFNRRTVLRAREAAARGSGAAHRQQRLVRKARVPAPDVHAYARRSHTRAQGGPRYQALHAHVGLEDEVGHRGHPPEDAVGAELGRNRNLGSLHWKIDAAPPEPPLPFLSSSFSFSSSRAGACSMLVFSTRVLPRARFVMVVFTTLRALCVMRVRSCARGADVSGRPLLALSRHVHI